MNSAKETPEFGTEAGRCSATEAKCDRSGKLCASAWTADGLLPLLDGAEAVKTVPSACPHGYQVISLHFRQCEVADLPHRLRFRSWNTFRRQQEPAQENHQRSSEATWATFSHRHIGGVAPSGGDAHRDRKHLWMNSAKETPEFGTEAGRCSATEAKCDRSGKLCASAWTADGLLPLLDGAEA
ncbi:hypothetical protein MHYP_G00285490 [Metynnis hypsauchen]